LKNRLKKIKIFTGQAKKYLIKLKSKITKSSKREYLDIYIIVLEKSMKTSLKRNMTVFSVVQLWFLFSLIKSGFIVQTQVTHELYSIRSTKEGD